MELSRHRWPTGGRTLLQKLKRVRPSPPQHCLMCRSCHGLEQSHITCFAAAAGRLPGCRWECRCGANSVPSSFRLIRVTTSSAYDMDGSFTFNSEWMAYCWNWSTQSKLRFVIWKKIGGRLMTIWINEHQNPAIFWAQPFFYFMDCIFWLYVKKKILLGDSCILTIPYTKHPKQQPRSQKKTLAIIP